MYLFSNQTGCIKQALRAKNILHNVHIFGQKYKFCKENKLISIPFIKKKCKGEFEAHLS